MILTPQYNVPPVWRPRPREEPGVFLPSVAP